MIPAPARERRRRRAPPAHSTASDSSPRPRPLAPPAPAASARSGPPHPRAAPPPRQAIANARVQLGIRPGAHEAIRVQPLEDDRPPPRRQRQRAAAQFADDLIPADLRRPGLLLVLVKRVHRRAILPEVERRAKK